MQNKTRKTRGKRPRKSVTAINNHKRTKKQTITKDFAKEIKFWMYIAAGGPLLFLNLFLIVFAFFTFYYILGNNILKNNLQVKMQSQEWIGII